MLHNLLMRLSENAHLPFGRLTALSKVEGLRYPHPSSLRRTSMYASFLGISEALHMDIFHQPLRDRFFDSLNISLNTLMRQGFWVSLFPFQYLLHSLTVFLRLTEQPKL
jgi:hypothetical protein